MTDEGINVIRAVAYSKDYLTSDIFTSRLIENLKTYN
jgi:hypothetical protein